MVKKKKSPVKKISKAATKTRATTTKSRRKHTSRASHVAAKTHAASVTYRDRSPYSSTAAPHRSRRHSASIIKAIILFLGFVLLLAILANIFAPSIERQNINRNNYMNSNPNRNNSGYVHPSRPPNSSNYQMNRQYVSPPASTNDNNMAPAPSIPENAPANQYRHIVPEEGYSAPQ